MPHRRSKLMHQKRIASRIVRKGAFHCKERAEYVNQLTEADIYDKLAERVRRPLIPVIKMFDRGEVLSDTRGGGTLERMIDDE